MRRWLPRFLWLLAWSFWAWCGFGLYRELPRCLGLVVCKLKLNQGEEVYGFATGAPEVVVRKRDYTAAKQVYVYSAIDALTGERLREIGARPNGEVWEGRRGARLGRDLTLTNDPWNAWLPSRWQTAALRDPDTFAVVAREWRGRVSSKPGMYGRSLHENPEQLLVADLRGVVYRYPTVNWPLLALCQTILALPLVLLWAMLRWRRMRMASAMP
jgi:hypothetical protein